MFLSQNSVAVRAIPIRSKDTQGLNVRKGIGADGGKEAKDHPFRGIGVSQGQRAKNDRIDAAMLAAFGAQRHPRPWQPENDARQELRALHERRRQMVKLRTSVLSPK